MAKSFLDNGFYAAFDHSCKYGTEFPICKVVALGREGNRTGGISAFLIVRMLRHGRRLSLFSIEPQSSKLLVAGPIPVSRSMRRAHFITGHNEIFPRCFAFGYGRSAEEASGPNGTELRPGVGGNPLPFCHGTPNPTVLDPSTPHTALQILCPNSGDRC
jgi:hypothetical protein